MFVFKGEDFYIYHGSREEVWKGGITGIVEGWIELHNLENGERRWAPRSQTLFGNVLVFAVTQPPEGGEAGLSNSVSPAWQPSCRANGVTKQSLGTRA
ncbi:MAG: hypothetical protein DME97_08975 [Verrucomicrobia bacterium]|nr:MAG: hypothetical protein DME97_08975 [Verrucomicrobiota bacterium]